MADVVPGQIIVLNGTSSAGKTSVGRELLDVLSSPFFLMSVDDFGAMRSPTRTAELSEHEVADVLRRTRAGFHRAVAGMAAAGNDVIMDYVFSEAWRLADCVRLFEPFRVFFVGIRCSLPELERRERARGDRIVGHAAAQVEAVHTPGIYDLECQTDTATPRGCALAIVEGLRNGPTPNAFQRLREREI
ncbi:MAG TPA: AAA family ATPase [Gaiellaceae bacterium]|nr:AAA family ATPase [Gaiellaceae bacterium]